MSIQEFQTSIDELFFTFDKNDNNKLSEIEYANFHQAIKGILKKCIYDEKKHKDFSFAHFYLDLEKSTLLDGFLDQQRAEHARRNRTSHLLIELNDIQDWFKENIFEMKTKAQMNFMKTDYKNWKSGGGPESGLSPQEIGAFKHQRKWYRIEPFDPFRWEKEQKMVTEFQQWKETEHRWDQRKDIQFKDYLHNATNVKAFQEYRECKWEKRQDLGYDDWTFDKVGSMVRQFQSEKEADWDRKKFQDFAQWIEELRDRKNYKKLGGEPVLKKTFEQWLEALRVEFDEWRQKAAEMRKDLESSFKIFKQNRPLLFEFQEWREQKWDKRSVFSLKNYMKQKKDFEDWIEAFKKFRDSYGVDTWKMYDERVKDFASFREQDWKRRQDYTLDQWMQSEADIRDLTRFKEENWEQRSHYQLDEWSTNKVKIQSYE
jgi:hypothetical protein